MAKVTLAGAMPGDGLDGLGPFAKEFLENPTEGHLVIAIVSSGKTVKNHDRNEEHPVLRIRHWEMVPARHKAKVAKALGDALGDRTGAAELPFTPGEQVQIGDPFPEESDAERDASFEPGGNRDLEGED